MWRAATTTPQDKKRLLRSLLEEVQLRTDENVVRGDVSMASAVAGLTGEQPPPHPPPLAPNAGVAAASKPKTGVDLAEIDRYLEGLGKL